MALAATIEADDRPKVAGVTTAMPEIDHPKLRQLYDYWDSKRAGRAMPARPDIDPLEIRPLLTNLALIDVEQEPRRYRYRLVGTELVGILGQELTGKYLDEMPLLYRTFAVGAYAEIMDRKTPTYHVFDTVIPAVFRSVRYKRLMLPLSPDGGETIGMIMAGFYRF